MGGDYTCFGVDCGGNLLVLVGEGLVEGKWLSLRLYCGSLGIC